MLINLIRVLRVISLAILSAGSVGVVIAAVAGVKSAQAHGLSVIEAASANAPVFVEYSKIALIASIFLIFTELLDYFADRKVDLIRLWRYAASVACFAATVFFALSIVPAMEKLRPDIQTSEEAHTAFQELHNRSRITVGGIVLFSVAAIVIPLANSIYHLRLEQNVGMTDTVSDQGQGEEKSEQNDEDAKKEENSE